MDLADAYLNETFIGEPSWTLDPSPCPLTGCPGQDERFLAHEALDTGDPAVGPPSLLAPTGQAAEELPKWGKQQWERNPPKQWCPGLSMLETAEQGDDAPQSAGEQDAM